MARIGGSPRRAALAYQPEPEDQGDRDIVVELDDYRRAPRQDTFELKHGEAVEVEDEDVETVGSDAFSRNLALDLDEDFLDDLGTEIIEKVEADIEEHRPDAERFEQGLEQMGLIESDIDDGPFPGASNAIHPLLIEARTQFWARAMGELWPPEGPVKCKVEGQQTQQILDRADRVAQYMNFEITTLDEGHIEEKSSMVWDLPFRGSCFVKTYRDSVLNQNVGIYVPREDLIAPAESKSLRTTPRFAHRMWKFPNEIRQLQLAGHYRQVDLDEPRQEEQDETQRLKDESQDVESDGDDNTNRYELFEVYIDLDLEGDEHIDEEGNKTGLERTYIVTIERQTGKVLSIYRGWREQDPQCRRRLYFRHYRFCPGQGFYGSGLFHLIGGLQVAATGTLRVLLDSAASASLSGGFVSKHANLKGKRLVMTPGTWEPVDATAEDLQKAFFSPPVKEPSPALFNLLGFLTEQGKSFTSTTELMTGDQDPKGSPVGTTAQMIEQGGKVMSTIHRMMYQELGAELRDRYELNREHAPPDGYPYEVAGQQRTVYADDFAPGVSVVPVADPNIFSSAQRMALNQMVYQVAMETGGVVPIKKAVRRLFLGARVPDVDELVPDDPEPMAYDPVGEIQAMFMGKPVKVVPEQLHVMHLKVLWAFASNPQFGANEQIQKQIGPQLLSVMGQHLAYAWATHARGAGVPVGYMDPNSGQVAGGQGTPEQIAAMLAQIAPALATVPGLPAIDEEGKDDKGDELEIKRAEIAMKREEHAQDMEMEKEKHAFEMQKEASKLEAQKQMDQQKVQLAAQQAQSKQQIAEVTAQQKMQQTQMQGQIAQQTAEQKMAHDQQNMQRQSEMDAQSMQQEQVMGQQEMAHKQRMGEQEAQLGQQKAATEQAGAVQGQRIPAGGSADKLAHLRANKPPQQPPGG